MHKYFLLRPSQTELRVVCGMLALAAIMSLTYQVPGIVQSIYLASILILGAGEIRMMRSAPIRYLVFTGDCCGIVAKKGRQPYFPCKNKVYQCRWFAILKQYESNKTRTEILFPDRFNSLQAYQECRFLLSRLQDT